MTLTHRQQLRADALATAEAEEDREAEAEAIRLERLPAGDADQGRGVAGDSDSGTRPGWAFWAGLPHHDPDYNMED